MSSKPPLRDSRIDRNWEELLQELRVTQTGIQILTGFLLTVPFSNRYTQLSHTDRVVYLVVLLGCVLAAALLVAPAAFHRMLFHQRQRPWLVQAAHRCALGGLCLTAFTSCGMIFLVVDFTMSRPLAIVISTVLALFFVALWMGAPLADHLRTRDDR
jgi:hypothetical protein